jgi:hypothetical protein
MNELPLTRRHFVQIAGLAPLAMPLLGSAALADDGFPGAPTPAGTELHWLDGKPPSAFAGVTWGTPWPQGQVPGDSAFELSDADGRRQQLQSWPLARWPDGSLKWSGHALAPQATLSDRYQLHPVRPGKRQGRDLLSASASAFHIDTGTLRCTVPRGGPLLIERILRAGRPALENGALTLLLQNDPDHDSISTRRYRSQVNSAEVEQNGPARALLTLRGEHRAEDGGTLLPFIVRLYFHAGSSALRILHTLVYDGSEKDFIRGLGLTFDVPLEAPLHDRHVRFVGAEGGLFAEAVRGLSGLRRDPGPGVIAAQLAGQTVPELSEPVASGLDYIPAFGSYRLVQAHSDAFSIAKRTHAGQGWLHAASGGRAAGTGYLGTPKGGVAFGIRNFWQSYPAQLDIDHAHRERAQVTLWLWSPQAEPMDMRSIHDGLDQDSHEKQRQARRSA